MLRLRPADGHDLAFLRSTLCEAAAWRPDRPAPTPDDVLGHPGVARYLAGWGRSGGFALIAEDASGRPLGAAWFQLFPADKPGYGFLDTATPEVAIGVVAGEPRRGIGTASSPRWLTASARRVS